MFGHFSYLASIVIFAGSAIVLEWTFGFHLLRKFIKLIMLTTCFSLLLVPTEGVALYIKSWRYDPSHTFNILLLGAELETYIFVIFIAVVIASAVIPWTSYEDKGQNIIKQTILDIFSGKYAIWKKS